MYRLPTEIHDKVMSHTDPKMFYRFMGTCKKFANLYSPMKKIIIDLSSSDEAVNIKALHYIIDNFMLYRNMPSKLLSLLRSYSLRDNVKENINIQILLDIISFLIYFDQQPHVAHICHVNMVNKVVRKLHNDLIIDYLLQKTLAVKNRPNKLSSAIINIQRAIVAVKSYNDNAGFCNQDSIIFYSALFYLHLDEESKKILKEKMLSWLSIQERSCDHELFSFDVMAANMRCLAYESTLADREIFNKAIIKDSRCLSDNNFTRHRGEPIFLEDAMACSVIRIQSVEVFSHYITTSKIKVFNPVGFLLSLLKKSNYSLISYLLIHNAKYFVDYLRMQSSSAISLSKNLVFTINKLRDREKVYEALSSCIKAIGNNDFPIEVHFAYYILRLNLGDAIDCYKSMDKIKELLFNTIKTFSLDTRLLLKEVFSNEQLVEIESFGLVCYKQCNNESRLESFLEHLVGNSVSTEHSKIACQLLKQHNFQKLQKYSKDFYRLSQNFKYLKYQDELTKNNFISHVVSQVKRHLNPPHKSKENFRVTFLDDVL